MFWWVSFVFSVQQLASPIRAPWGLSLGWVSSSRGWCSTEAQGVREPTGEYKDEYTDEP